MKDWGQRLMMLLLIVGVLIFGSMGACNAVSLVHVLSDRQLRQSPDAVIITGSMLAWMAAVVFLLIREIIKLRKSGGGKG